MCVCIHVSTEDAMVTLVGWGRLVVTNLLKKTKKQKKLF